MRISRLIAIATTVLGIGGCTDSRDIAGPTAARREVAASPAQQIDAVGEFDALVDFSTLTLTPRGRNCLLQVNGRLVFDGTLEGEAIGQTTALVFAPCGDVATNPPGTFRDVFKSELVFEGTVDGEPAQANVLYMGRVQPGGQIEGRLIFSKGVQGRLEVEAQVAVGGEYSGSVIVN
jgi:hypothetical protein